MACEVAEIMLQMVFNGSISMYDMDIDRRPYHQNCSCALHKLKRTCPQHRNISFSQKRTQNYCLLSVDDASKFSFHASSFNDQRAGSQILRSEVIFSGAFPDNQI
ncbi:uncharacterized protein Fot_36442 [Forsythia ovata]|uniref:Uncharacterized protein n=1 Tax=Forsythia ovata TaxID=205694 RepID=A0ABD1SPG7_9LAMI